MGRKYGSRSARKTPAVKQVKRKKLSPHEKKRKKFITNCVICNVRGKFVYRNLCDTCGGWASNHPTILPILSLL